MAFPGSFQGSQESKHMNDLIQICIRIISETPAFSWISLRIFKNSDVSSSVLKSAPNFCNVYIIYKGKVSAMRPASRSAQAIHAVERNQTIYHNATQSDPDM